MEHYIPAMIFAFVSSITPGPNNTMLLVSGVHFGLKRSLPHMLGVAVGFVIMLILVGLGMAAIIMASPLIDYTLKILCGLYLVYLAWSLATSGELIQKSGEARPMFFYEAALFQWINPKAWAMALAAMSLFVDAAHSWQSVLSVSVIFGTINLPSILCWVVFGVSLRRFLADPLRLRIFNVTMAILLLASVFPLFLKM